MLILGSFAATLHAESSQAILEATGVKGGLVVHLGCGDGKLTAALRANYSYVVHGLDADAKNIEAARKHIQSLGLYGPVSVEQWTDAGRLPYVDNLVNLLVISDSGSQISNSGSQISNSGSQISEAEVMRVLAPNGVAYVKGKDGKWAKSVKPRPKDIDEWTHFLHDASNNAVAADSKIGPPRRVQWKAGPIYARQHDTLCSVSAAVSAGGRVFYIIDEGPTSLMYFPPKWQLVARDAFNGTPLWERSIPTWENYLRTFRSGPPQLPRRLVASGDRVYVTLGLNVPVSQIDAATGKTLQTYPQTEGADEILLTDGTLVLVRIDPAAWEAQKADLRWATPPATAARQLLAVDAASGRILWQKSGDQTVGLKPCGVAAGGGFVVFVQDEDVRCVELASGRDVWRQATAGGGKKGKNTAPAGAEADDSATTTKKAGKPGGSSSAYYAPTLVLAAKQGVVLLADRGALAALDLKSGRVLWHAGAPRTAYASPADVFLIDGLVWSGLFANEGLDVMTGKVQRKIDIGDLLTAGHHPRCYRNKATDRWLIFDKRGMEFFDLKSDNHSRNNWVRGVCQYGILPANGLIYTPPNACCCYAEAQVHGFYALAPAMATPRQALPDDRRLLEGPAFKAIVKPESPAKAPGEWPTFRADATRRGSTAVAVAAKPVERWQTAVGGKLTQPVVAGGLLLVGQVDTGRITALDAGTGRLVWSFDAGGRVDTPPTIHAGRALFGAADGRVYCLRLSDGQLAWRFDAAPVDQRILVDGRLESVWPARGNVLVLDGTAYFAVGRSPYLDGGITLYGLDADTGRKLHEARVVIENQDQDEATAFVMAGVQPDVLVTDGKYVYLQHLKFDRELKRQEGFGRHLMAHAGLADDSWFYRAFWRLGYGDAYNYTNSNIKYDLQVPFGQLLVFDDQTVCGLQTHFSTGIAAAKASDAGRGCTLFGDPSAPLSPDGKLVPDRDYPPEIERRKTPQPHRWTAELPFQPRAMVMAGERLFVAGWPDVVDAKDPYAAIEGRKGGVMWVFGKGDGRKVAEIKLDSPPVFDGLIAACGRLYVSMRDGRVLCMGGE